MKAIKNISIIGAGKVAGYLAPALHDEGYCIQQVYNRTFEKAKDLAGEVNAEAIHRLTELKDDADLYLLCVKDDAIPDVASAINIRGIVAHTSGSVAMEVLKKASEKTGIFYPLQTFTGRAKIDLKEVPFCIEGNSEATETILKKIAKKLSDQVVSLTSEERKTVHLAAVFANNFTNYLYSISDTLLRDKNLSPNILLPLIKRTALNIENSSPALNQTGPAIRKDQETIKMHLEYLKDYPNFQELYKFISENIQKNGKEL